MPEHTAQSFFPGDWSAPTTLATSTRTEPELALGKSAQPVGSLAQAYSSSANISAWVPARLQPADRWLRLLGHHLLHSRPHPSAAHLGGRFGPVTVVIAGCAHRADSGDGADPAGILAGDRVGDPGSNEIAHQRRSLHPGRVEDRDRVVDIFAEPVRRHAGEQSLSP